MNIAMSLMTFDDIITLLDGIEQHNIVFWENGRDFFARRDDLHH